MKILNCVNVLKERRNACIKVIESEGDHFHKRKYSKFRGQRLYLSIAKVHDIRGKSAFS